MHLMTQAKNMSGPDKRHLGVRYRTAWPQA